MRPQFFPMSGRTFSSIFSPVFIFLDPVHFERIKEWLTARTAKEIRIRMLLATLGLILTPIGIAVGALVIFIIARAFSRDSTNPNIDVKCFWFALISIPVLFLLNLLMPRQTKDV